MDSPEGERGVRYLRRTKKNGITPEEIKNTISRKSAGVADLRAESSLVGFFKPRPKLTFRYDAQLAFIP
jgi:hypothetical protein